MHNPDTFRSSLLKWYNVNKRPLPWRDIDDPYKTWLSEIMLQQTRVDQAMPYYKRFLKLFPTVGELARADQQEILKAWEGLGYYSRARNMHRAAQTIVEEFGGEIPDTRKEILSLKGVGPYTAAAVLSIAYNQPHAVVDGNVIRVLSRYYGIEDDVRSSRTRKQIQKLADELVDPKRPGDFNQALMELGATVCTPSNPDCGGCPLRAGCTAYRQLKTDVLPYKSPTTKKPHHHIGVGIIENDDGRVLIALRREEAMLGGMWEFPGGKQEEHEDIQKTVQRELREELGVDVAVKKSLMKLNHAYSHFSITLHAFICRIREGTPKPKSSQGIKWVTVPELNDYPFPKANRQLTEKLMELYENGELKKPDAS